MKLSTYYKQLTIIIVTYHSDLVENLIKQIDRKIKIIIIENSLRESIKKKLQSKYKNLKVIIPKKNLGVGGGINLGLKSTKTKYALHLSVDIKVGDKMISKLIESANQIKKFAIIVPREKKTNYPKNIFYNYKKNDKFHKIKFVAGYVMLFNMSQIKKIGYFDENIFLYFEEYDYFLRCKEKKLNLYLINKALVNHFGHSSINRKFTHEINLNRCWHYCWSKFYFYQKHYGYFYGLSKTFPNLIRALKYSVKYLVIGDFKQVSLHISEIKGLLNSYFLMKSSRRPSINL